MVAYVRVSHKSTEDDELVHDGMECPNCGERRFDCLASYDGVVTCETCGVVYDLEPEREEAAQ